MKILVVDDEPRHLRGMVSLIRQLRPDAQVTAAKDGAAALEQVKQMCPEAILTDIRMPRMDGLAFLEKLKEEGIETKVVMISAYNLFEYAQMAVRHGAFDYLLKPVEIENVKHLLDRIDLQLSTESLQRKETEEMKHRLTLASSAYRSRLYLSWLNESLTPSEQEEMDKTEWLQGGGIVIYSELQFSRPDEEKISGLAYLQSLERGWSKLGKAMTILHNGLEDRSCAAVTVVRTPPLAPELERRVREIAASLSEELSTAGRLTHGIGPYCDSLSGGGPQAYRAAQTANERNFFECWDGLFYYDKSRPACDSPVPIDSERLFEALLGNEVEHAVDQCRSAFERLSDDGYAQPSLMKEQASLLLMKVKSRVHDLVDRQVGSLLTQASASLLQECDSYGRLLELLETSIREVYGALTQAQQDKNEIIVANCLRWIEEHAKEELTLERAAAHFFFNPSYFSTFIKSKTGRTFSEHVTAARMRRAKALLADNRLRIYEISAECGYQDTKYFCRVFKKHHGISPEAYKHTSLPERKRKE
ncbi:response regulator [Cohnella cellulosilytica]